MNTKGYILSFLLLCLSVTLWFQRTARWLLATNAGETHPSLVPTGEPLPQQGHRNGLDCSAIRVGQGKDAINDISYWHKDPSQVWDYKAPYGVTEKEPKYVSFEVDAAGWNNRRLSFENLFVFAAVTGRTLVMPEKMHIPMMGKSMLDFQSFYPLHLAHEAGVVEIISVGEFFEREAKPGKLILPLPPDIDKLNLHQVRKYLSAVAERYEGGLPEAMPGEKGLIFTEPAGGESYSDEEIEGWLSGRIRLDYDETWQSAKLIHWRSDHRVTRLLAPFYTFIMHKDPHLDRYFKRLVREFLHYPDALFCKASQVLEMIEEEAGGDGSFSAMHVRRGDFLSEYPQVIFTGDHLMQTTAEYVNEGELLFIMTDEKDREFFKPLESRYKVRFLGQYFDRAGVQEINPMQISLLEAIIASHGRTFTGTYFSTLSAYVLRLRGYLGQPRDSSWFPSARHRTEPHETMWPRRPYWFSEWYQGWEGIDEP
ncbi:unnamed protein product [Chrysoparadoxa australica]